ncbi:MAG: T9SS type A sorting domain-containing protein [Taibaiella sp.]|nr:T9SS type A sorting domain-containing protein [Taibaiella sp.]
MKYLIILIAALIMCMDTQAQLVLLKDINPGPAGSKPIVLGVNSKGLVFIVANDGTHGNELWVSDGTTQGTQMLKDINPGAKDGIHNTINNAIHKQISIMYQDKLYFFANDGVHGNELWISDGTTTGTYMIKDIYPGLGWADNWHADLVGYNNKVYFRADDSVHGYELWRTDGTDKGTQMVIDLSDTVNSYPHYMYVANGKIYFAAHTHPLFKHTTWYYTDGTANGTKAVSRHESRFISPLGPLTQYKGDLYFTGDHYISPATGGGSSDVCRITNDTAYLFGILDSVSGGSSGPELFTTGFDKLFFRAMNRMELWATDGTLSGTKRIHKSLGVVTPITEVNGRFIFSAPIPNVYAMPFWSIDSTLINAMELKDNDSGRQYYGHSLDIFYDLATYRRYNNYTTTHNNQLYFYGAFSNIEAHLWTTNGSDTGTMMMARANKSGSDSVIMITVIDSMVWVTCTDGSTGTELYLSKLTPDPKLSVSGIVQDKTVAIHPNPNKGIFTVTLNNSNFLNGYLQVTDITGKDMYNQSINKGSREVQVHLPTLTTGIYIVSVNLDGYLLTGKIFVE